MLRAIGAKPPFRAHFMCVLTLAFPDGEMREFRGPGRWRTGLSRRAGRSVFGYDPIFLPENLGKTFGEMTLEEKQAIPRDGSPAFVASRARVSGLCARPPSRLKRGGVALRLLPALAKPMIREGGNDGPGT